MVAVDGMSFLISGLDSWSVVGEKPISEFRLSQILGSAALLIILPLLPRTR